MESIADLPHAFFERTDSENKGSVVVLIAFLAFIACCALTIFVIVEQGGIGLWLIPLPVLVLVFAGIALNRMKAGPKKGYSTRSEVIVQMDGEKKRILRFDEIRQLRRVTDSAGITVFLKLHPYSGDAMVIENLESDRLAGLDRWISSGMPATVERHETRETTGTTFLYRHGSMIQLVALISLPRIINLIAGLTKKEGDTGYLLLALLLIIASPRLPVKNREEPDYDGKLSAGKTIGFILSRCLAVASLCAYKAGVSVF